MSRREGTTAAQRRWDNLFELRSLGIVVVGGLFFGAIAVSRISGVVESGELTPVTAASFVLLALAFLLLLLWGWSTQVEMSMLRDVGRAELPPLPGSSFPLVVAAGVSLGALGAATAWPGVFGGMYAVLKLIEYLGLKRITGLLAVAFGRIREGNATEDRLQAVETLDQYYRRRAWQRLQAYGFASGAVALALAVAAQTGSAAAADFELASYIVLIVAIVLNEAVVGYWRTKRTTGLPESYR